MLFIRKTLYCNENAAYYVEHIVKYACEQPANSFCSILGSVLGLSKQQNSQKSNKISLRCLRKVINVLCGYRKLSGLLCTG